jgi:hypothetical protein
MPMNPTGKQRNCTPGTLAKPSAISDDGFAGGAYALSRNSPLRVADGTWGILL